MEQTVVTATTGRDLGTRPSRRLRAEGKLPAVVYGLGKDPVSVCVDYADLRDALKGDGGMNTVLQLVIEGGDTETVIVRSVQRHPIRREVTHADFLRVDADQRVKVKVPIVLIGDGSTVTNAGGLIEQKMFEVELEVSPGDIPSEVEADLSMMDMTTRIAVGDLKLPAGVTTTVDPEIAVVIPVASRAAKKAANEGDEDAGGDEAGDEQAEE